VWNISAAIWRVKWNVVWHHCSTRQSTLWGNSLVTLTYTTIILTPSHLENMGTPFEMHFFALVCSSCFDVNTFVFNWPYLLKPFICSLQRYWMLWRHYLVSWNFSPFVHNMYPHSALFTYVKVENKVGRNPVAVFRVVHQYGRFVGACVFQRCLRRIVIISLS